MKFIRELQENTRFDPQQDKFDFKNKSGQEQDDVRELLDAVAHAIPFIGYESSVEHIKNKLDAAFKQVSGMDWHEWRKTRENKKQ